MKYIEIGMLLFSGTGFGDDDFALFVAKFIYVPAYRIIRIEMLFPGTGFGDGHLICFFF